MANKSGVSAQATSLPVGGGDIRGLGESFQPDLNTGTGQYRVGLELPTGVRQFQPSLALVYSTGAGNGPYGHGWSLPVPAISRRVFRGVPRYDDVRDIFVYNTSELVPVGPGRFRAAVENGFERFERTPTGWTVTDRSGTRHQFGATAAARIEVDDGGGSVRTFSWLLERSEDPCGNAIEYRYIKDGAQAYLSEVRYAIYRVGLEYEGRPDVLSDFRVGFELRTALRCRRITVQSEPAGPTPVRSWRLEYGQAALSEASLLARVTMTGHDPVTGVEVSLPALELGYTEMVPAARNLARFSSVGAPPPPLGEANADLLDFDGRALPGVVVLENGGVTYWSNVGGNRWAPPRSLPRLPAAVSLDEDRVRLADMDGDGGTDILVGRGPFSGYYVNSGRGGWEGVNHYAQSPSLLFDENDLHLVDIDGDGLVDAVHSGRTGLQVYVNRGRAGWDPPRLLPRGDPARERPDITTADPRVRLSDMNGDGLLDVVHIASGRIEYWPSRGNGRYEPGRTMANAPRFPYPFDPERVLLVDVNGDGLTDVVYVAYDEIIYWINRSGTSFSPPQRIRCTPPTGVMGNLRIADMKGLGAAGLLWTGPQADYRFLSFVGDVKPGLLTRIDNHLGRVVEVEYSTSPAMALADAEGDQPWSSFLPFPLQVVASITVRDTTRGLQTRTEYRYHDGHFDGARRELDGFARAEQLEIGDGSQPTARTVHFFHTEASARTLVADAEARRTLKRKLHRVEVYGLDGSAAEARPNRIEETVWAVRTEETTADGRRVLFPFVAETSVLTTERSADGSGRLERRQFMFDAYGNVIEEVRTGRPASGSPTLYTRTVVEYALNESAWVLDRTSRMVMRDETGALLSEIRQYYDGPAFVGLPLGQVTRGQLARTERVALHVAQATAIFGSSPPDFAALGFVLGSDADGNPAWLIQQERRQVDARGNVTAKQDPRGNLTSYTFDGFGLFATSIAEPNGLSGTVTHDYAVGRPVRFVDPNKGVVEARYDPLGRLATVAAPGDTLALPTTRFFYDTSSLPPVRRTEQRVRTGQPELLQVFEYLDGGGGLFQRRSQHETGLFVVSGHEVPNARGKTARKFDPFFEAGGAFTPYVHGPDDPQRAYFYDALGRPTETTMPTGGRSRVVQEAGRALFYDAGDNDPSAPSFGTPRIEHCDAWQRLVAVEQPSGAGSVTTSYALDRLGRLAQVTDVRGVVLTRIDYDLVGRRLRIRHADAGERFLVHDAAGNLAEAVDGEGRRASYSYDGLNRLTEVRHEGTVVERMTYDTGAGTNVASRLASVEDAAGTVTYSYDVRGNTVRQARTITGETTERAIALEYDGAARVRRLTYPDGVSVDFDYGTGFLLKSVPGYVGAIDYEPTGVRKAVHYANGTRTDYVFDPATTRLRELKTWHPASGQVHHHIRYDVTIGGNIDAIAELRAGGGPGIDRSQSFTYDAFDRLTSASGNDGAGPYTHQYGYDEVDNLTRNPLLGPGTLVYAPGTNRLTGRLDGGVETPLFGYDASGNMTSMPGRTLVWNVRQQLERVTLASGAEVRYRYDHRGMLARKDVSPPGGGPAVRTLYFDNLFDLEGTTATRWVYAGDLPIAFERGGTRVFIHGDQLQSAAVFTDSAGALLGEAAHYPFGAVAKAPAAGLEALFAKKRQDPDTGLVYMGARWYAPDVGRFISPDPLYLLKPEDGIQDPRRLNPYAYAGNNPLRYVDPRGLGFWDVLVTIVIVAAIVVAAIVFAPAAIAALGALSLSTVLFVGGGLMLGGALVGAIIGGIVYGSWEGALRGAMIGFVAGANAFIGGVLFGPIVGAALGIIGFLSLFPPIAQSDVYQFILGWSSYFMPMSWPGHAIGVTLFIINVVPYLVTFGQVDSLRIKDVVIDWKTGNIFTVGGWVGNAGDRAFNVGAFTFVNESRYVDGEIIAATFEHESGHMLNNAAFGIFQATFIFTGGAVDAYWERLAESNVPDGLRGSDPVAPEPDRPKLPQWG